MASVIAMKISAENLAVNPKRILTGSCLECGKQVSGFSAQRMMIKDGDVGLELGIYTTLDYKPPDGSDDEEFHIYDRVRLSDIPQPVIAGGIA